MRVLVTGAAGFIGFHLCKTLIERGIICIGLDNYNPYYDPSLKKARTKELEILGNKKNTKFKIHNIELENIKEIENLFNEFKPNIVVNLAAQAGVRHSIENPKSYIKSNLEGFGNILEACRNIKIKHLIYASSSSVYGGNTNMPFSEAKGVDHPVSLYAASKRANELMAHSYSHLYGIPSTGLRFFTVYGPWGRPDMALFLFTDAIINNQKIKVFNNGEMKRDFTYIDDVIESIFKLLSKPPVGNNSFDKNNPKADSSWAPFRIFNIGNSKPTGLMKYIEAIEKCLQKKAIKEFLPMQPGDVKETHCDASNLQNYINFSPSTSIEIGVRNFVSWYKDYYGVQ